MILYYRITIILYFTYQLTKFFIDSYCWHWEGICKKKTRSLSNETTQHRKQIHIFACCCSLIHFISWFFGRELLYLRKEKTHCVVGFHKLEKTIYCMPLILLAQGFSLELHKNIKENLQCLWILDKIVCSL